MCLGCSMAAQMLPMEYMATNSDYRVGVYLKMNGWNNDSMGQYQYGSGGCLTYCSSGRGGCNINSWGHMWEVDVPTVEELKNALPEGFLGNPEYDYMITMVFTKDRKLSDLEKWAQLWVVSRLVESKVIPHHEVTREKQAKWDFRDILFQMWRNYSNKYSLDKIKLRLIDIFNDLESSQTGTCNYCTHEEECEHYGRHIGSRCEDYKSTWDKKHKQQKYPEVKEGLFKNKKK